MMKVLGICASARKNGNTAIMMRKVFEALEKEGIETELVQFAGTVIEPCKAGHAQEEETASIRTTAFAKSSKK